MGIKYGRQLVDINPIYVARPPLTKFNDELNKLILILINKMIIDIKYKINNGIWNGLKG